MRRARQRSARSSQSRVLEEVSSRLKTAEDQLQQIWGLLAGPPGLGMDGLRHGGDFLQKLETRVDHLEKFMLFVDVDEFNTVLKRMACNGDSVTASRIAGEIELLDVPEFPFEALGGRAV